VNSTSGHGGTAFLLVWSIFAIGMGTLGVTRPRVLARGNRWQWKNSQALEPSAAYLLFARVLAGVFLVVGIVCLVISLTQL
jgi:hypothetical protein